MTWLPALLTGGLALLGGLTVSFLNHRSLRRLANAKVISDRHLAEQHADGQRRLARLEHLLSEESAEAGARRAYKYEALNRLYASVKPLLFQLGELCEISNRRIDKILDGTIRLSPQSTSVHTSAYHIGAPLVVVRALRQRLTTLDLRVDPMTRDQYLVARELLFVLRNGDELVRYSQPLPHLQTSEAPRQHITVRQLDGLLESLSYEDVGSARILRTYFQFENECLDASSRTAQLVGMTIDLFRQAHPEGTPVLWRGLMTQRLLQMALLHLLENDDFPAVAESLRRPSTEPYMSAFDEALAAGKAYLARRGISLPGLAP
jgi:hypothetical protein